MDEADAAFADLARYVAGECSADEAAAIERRLEVEPELRRVLTEMQAIWQEARLAPSGWDAEGAWRSLLPRLDSAAAQRPLRIVPVEGTQPRPVGPARSLRSRRRQGMPPALRVAAVLAMVAIGGVMYTQRSGVATSPAAREFVTRVGERSQFQLDDGTRVTLGVDSRLHVAAGYGRRERRVALEGTALFEVPRGRPFVVGTAEAEIEVLGTRFDVRSYTGETATQVVVAEGRVQLRAGDGRDAREVVLASGQLGVATAAGEVSVRTDVDVARYHAWTEGRLVFERTPLANALPELSRWYGLEFRLGDPSLAQRPLTATISNQPTAQILDLLALALDVRLERRGRTIIFHARNNR